SIRPVYPAPMSTTPEETPARPLSPEEERLRRWRLVLGGGPADGTGVSLGGEDMNMDRCLGALYDGQRGGLAGYDAKDRRGGLGNSTPTVARWLGDIRTYFPSSVV